MTLIVGREWLKNRGRNSSDFDEVTRGTVEDREISEIYVDRRLGLRPYNGQTEPLRGYNSWDNAARIAEAV